ncbi:SETMR methyltransferase, partial [Acromyrmex insinuator]
TNQVKLRSGVICEFGSIHCVDIEGRNIYWNALPARDFCGISNYGALYTGTYSNMLVISKLQQYNLEQKMLKNALALATHSPDAFAYQCKDFVANDRNASLKMMEEALNISRETIRTRSILQEDLGKTKVCAKFVPHTLRSDQKSARINYSRDIVAAAENNPNFLKSIVTGNETWCFQYDPETKRQSAEWKSKNSPQYYPKVLYKEFVPIGQTITDAYYFKVLKRLMGRIHRIHPEYRDPENWSLLHDNAPSHTSLIVRQCLARNRVVSVLNHPPYSPDLASCDFSLFPKLKLKLKGRFFDDIPTIQSASTQALEAIPQTELEHAFESLLNRCNKYIEARGEYFE